MTYSSRRRFVVGGMVVTAGAGVAGCSGGSSSSGSVVAPTADATPSGPILTAAEPSEWDKLVGSAFTITTDSGSKIAATLAGLERITDASRPSDLARRQPFFASFQTAAGQAPAGGKTYQLSHATKGDFQLFLGLSSTVSGKDMLTAVLN